MQNITIKYLVNLTTVEKVSTDLSKKMLLVTAKMLCVCKSRLLEAVSNISKYYHVRHSAGVVRNAQADVHHWGAHR